MKVQIINHTEEQPIQETRSGVFVWNGKGDEFRISLNQFGELEINCSRKSILVKPNVSNEVVIKTE